MLKFASANMDTEMAAAAGENLAYQVSADFVIGNGVSKSEGIMENGSVNAYTSLSSADVSFDDFFKIQGKTYIKSAYGKMGKFYLNSDTLFDLATRVSGLGTYLWVGTGAAGLPPTLAGKPYEVCNDLAGLGSSAEIGFFGDLKKAYYILRASGIELVVDPYSAKGDGMIEYMWIEFIGGKVALPEAIVKIKCGA